MAHDSIAFQVRINKDDLNWLRKHAAANNRSVAQEIRHMIQIRKKRATK